MQLNYKTNRLILNKLTVHDAAFIFELVNTPGWIKFIGDRNVKTTEDAFNYIQKIISNAGINYWVVKLEDKQIAVGIITFIKRDYLEYHDIGFAFLPAYAKQGYAFEAALAVLTNLVKDKEHSTILATTIKENEASIQLLKKLGFTYRNEIKNGNDLLHVYAVNAGRLYVSV